MIIYALWLFEVDTSHLAEFVAAFRKGGIWYEWSHCIPGHIHTDLLCRTEKPSHYHQLLSISFFTSLETLLQAEQSSEIRAFLNWMRERANLCVRLGTFSFLPRPGAEIASMRHIEVLGTTHAQTEVHA